MVPFFRAVRVKEGGEGEAPWGRVATPSLWGEAYLSQGRKATPHCWRARLRSLVFELKVALNVDRFRRNLAEMIFGTSPRDCQADFVICHQGAKLLNTKGEKMGVLAVFGDF